MNVWFSIDYIKHSNVCYPESIVICEFQSQQKIEKQNLQFFQGKFLFALLSLSEFFLARVRRIFVKFFDAVVALILLISLHLAFKIQKPYKIGVTELKHVFRVFHLIFGLFQISYYFGFSHDELVGVEFILQDFYLSKAFIKNDVQ